jgi:hypothetical protein
MLSCTIRIMKLRVACIGVVAGLAALVCVGTVIHPAHAVPSGQAFSITPPLIELQADPGQTVNATLKLTNVSPSELLVKTQFNDFGPKNETGEPNIIFEDNKNTPYSLRRWFASPDPFTLKTAETRTLTFPIAVPKSAEPGGHYAVIRFTGSLPGVEDKGVALSASIGTLVLMRVSGNIQEKAALLDYFSATPKFDTSSFFEFSPVSFVERIKNQGNVHIKPTGTIELVDMLGHTTQTLRVNGNPTDQKDVPKNILPASIRRFDQTASLPFMFGRYQAKLKLSYGSPSQTLTGYVTFWVIPYKVIILIVIELILLFFGVRLAIRRYKKYIITRAKSR